MRIAVKIPIKDCKSAGGALFAFPVAHGKIAPKWGSRRLRNDMHQTGPTVTTGRLDRIYSIKSPDFITVCIRYWHRQSSKDIDIGKGLAFLFCLIPGQNYNFEYVFMTYSINRLVRYRIRREIG